MSDQPPGPNYPPPPPIPYAPPPPPTGAYAPPPGSYQTPPTYQPPPPGQPPGAYPPAVPPGAYAAGAGVGLMYQFGGPAAWSIGCGLVSIIVPFVTNFYFPILPIIGLLNGVRAMQRGRLIGGVVGLVVNLIGGVVSLIASGLILR